MEITRTMPSSITLEKDGFTTKMLGEFFARGYGSPDFVIQVDSIEKWTGGNCQMPIDESERREIVEFVLTELRHRGWIIEAEQGCESLERTPAPE